MSIQPLPASLSARDTTPMDFNKLWHDALKRYRKETKKDLSDHYIAKNLKNLSSLPSDTDEAIQFFEKQKELLKTFRHSGAKARKVLKLIVDAVLPFLDAGAEAASVRVPIAYS